MTSIANAVVAKVASIAAREVPSVHGMGGGVSKALSGSERQRVGWVTSAARASTWKVGEREAAVDLTVIIDYGESIPEISEQIRDNVIPAHRGHHGLACHRGQRRGQ